VIQDSSIEAARGRGRDTINGVKLAPVHHAGERSEDGRPRVDATIEALKRPWRREVGDREDEASS
jgi:hypothetical protein